MNSFANTRTDTTTLSLMVGHWLAIWSRQNEWGFATKATSHQITPATLIAEGPRVLPQSKTSGGHALLARFQRDIVPQLDAAYNFARYLSRDPDAAQDIVQDAFLRAYRSFDGYQGGDPRAWIFTIVRNCYHNWLKERRRKSRVEIDAHHTHDPSHDESAIENVPSDDDTPEALLIRRAEVAAVRVVLNDMPRAMCEMLVLRELEGFSYKQIADITALPIGTVMSRLARARKQFEGAWQQLNYQVGET
jgi:RNA polymerase sigma-70 factor (ECF subfamily)